MPVKGRWPELPFERISGVVSAIESKIASLGPRVGGQKPFIPAESPEARLAADAFEEWIQTQDRSQAARLVDHFRRDLVIRSFFGSGTITLDAVERSILWAKDQLELRRALWPDDRGGPVEVFERRILDTLKRRGVPMTDRDLVKACHVNREGSGGRDMYSRAIKSLLYGSREIETAGANRKKQPYYILVTDSENETPPSGSL